MKRILQYIVSIIICLSISAANKKPLTEKEAIVAVTSHPLFQVYEHYLKTNYGMKEVYKVSGELFGYGYDPFGDYYILTFQSLLSEPFKSKEVDFLVVQVSAFSGKAIVFSFYYKGGYYGIDTSILKETY